MSKYGLKIRNIKAATLYGYNNGTRVKYEYTDALLANSLFADFLVANGLRVRGEGTRDVICLDFSYGTRSFEDEMAYAKTCGKESDVEAMRDKYRKMGRDELRALMYKDGVDVKYWDETIHYKMLYRNPSKAKTGQVMFVADHIYDKAYDWITMGIGKMMPSCDAKIVELSAYAPLTSSAIVGRITVPVENMLIVRDQSSFFTTIVKTVAAEDSDDGKKMCVVRDEEAEVENVLWDGMALIDVDTCPDWVNGMALLRNHFFKACAFKTKIQLFFQDWCLTHDKDYDTYEVADMFGHYHKVKDIQIITTDNAIKFKKFAGLLGGMNKAYEYWAERVRADGCVWGVVKTDHKSKLGNVQQMSYQMVNTLTCGEDAVAELAQGSIDYIMRLKSDPKAFCDYLRKNANVTNIYNMMADLYEWNEDFANTSWFRYEKKEVIKVYMKRMRNGKITSVGDNLTVCGNPYSLLLYSAGDECWRDDPTLCAENGVIQCYTPRFLDGEYLCGIRSPHNSTNNMSFFRNRWTWQMREYFPFSENIIAVNGIGTDIQSRMNGMDYDSDFMFVTNNPVMVASAEDAYHNYPTIVNRLREGGVVYGNTPEDFAAMDSKLARSQMSIGESSNVAQTALSYYWSAPSKELYDVFVILSVIAQVCIDSAKRVYEIDPIDEIRRIKKLDCMRMPNGKDYPEFMRYTRKVQTTKNGKQRPLEDIQVDRNKIQSRINSEIRCPMNYLLSALKSVPEGTRIPTTPTKNFFIKNEKTASKKRMSKMRELAKECSDYIHYIRANVSDDKEAFNLICIKYDDVVKKIASMTTKDDETINRLIELAMDMDSEEEIPEFQRSIFRKYATTLLLIIYKIDRDKFLSNFVKKEKASE